MVAVTVCNHIMCISLFNPFVLPQTKACIPPFRSSIILTLKKLSHIQNVAWRCKCTFSVTPTLNKKKIVSFSLQVIFSFDLLIHFVLSATWIPTGNHFYKVIVFSERNAFYKFTAFHWTREKLNWIVMIWSRK